MTPDQYLSLKERLLQAGYEEEITWAEMVGPPKYSEQFFMEYAWVVVSSGMKNQIAKKIWDRIMAVLWDGGSVCDAFHHPGKCQAIEDAWENRSDLFYKFLQWSLRPADEVLDWLQTLPWIGPITKYHLAKNLGMDVCKPDRHLVRIAGGYGKTPEELCSALAEVTGDRIGTVDIVIWRAANLGWI